jgi:hypothetical protein
MDPKLEAYRLELLKLLDKSNESFEKQLTFISSGALGISMAFIKEIVGDLSKARMEGLLIGSWLLLALTLLVNLLSHTIAHNLHSLTAGDINLNGDNYNYKKAIARNKTINYINYGSIVSLIAGLVLLICFIYQNI